MTKCTWVVGCDWKRRGAPEYIEEILSGGVTADATDGA